MSLDAGEISYSVSLETAALTRGERIAGRSTRNVEQGFDRVDQKGKQLRATMTRLAGAIGSVFAARQLQRFIIGTAEAIDEQNKFAQQVGVSFEELQRLQFVATQTGGSITGMNNSLRRGSRRIAEAAEGGGAAADALERVGLSARDLVNVNPAEQFRAISDAISRLPESEQGAVANAVFGRDGEFLLNALRLGRDGVDELANSLDSVISDQAAQDAANFNDELDRLSRAAGVAGGQLAGEMLPALTSMINTITQVVNDGETMSRVINGVGMAAQAASVVFAARLTVSIFSSVAAMRTATTAAVALRGAMAFLGGPAGILLLAGAAMVKFGSDTRDAEERARDLSSRVDDLTGSLNDLDETVARNRIRRFRADIVELEAEIDRLDRKAREASVGGQQGGFMGQAGRAQASGLRASANAAREDVEVLTQAADRLEAALNGELPDAMDQSSQGMDGLAESARNAVSPVQAVMDQINREFRGIGPDDDPFADPGEPRQDSAQDPGDIGLTRLQALERRFEQEQQLLLDAQEAKIESEVAYEERLMELRRQYSAQRQELMEEEKGGFVAALESMGLSFATLENQAVGTITNMATGLQSSSDAARDLGRAIITQIVGALVKTAAAKAVETAMGVSQAATLAAAYQPAAISASIATGGAAATSGAAAVIGATNTMTAALNMGPGRLNGGPVQPGMMHPVTEDGKPELLVQNGKQYLLPGDRGGEVVSNRDMQAGGGDNINLGGLNLTVHGDVNRRQIEDVVFDLEPRIYQMIESGKARRGRRF